MVDRIVVQKMTHLLLGHRFFSRLRSHVKFHTIQFQQEYEFLNSLTKIVVMTDVLIEECW